MIWDLSPARPKSVAALRRTADEDEMYGAEISESKRQEQNCEADGKRKKLLLGGKSNYREINVFTQ